MKPNLGMSEVVAVVVVVAAAVVEVSAAAVVVAEAAVVVAASAAAPIADDAIRKFRDPGRLNIAGPGFFMRVSNLALVHRGRLNTVPH
jgi:hypothetical protein